MASSISTQLIEDLDIKPLSGKLVPLKTKGELEAETDLIDVHVVAVNPRRATDVVALIKETFPASRDLELAHLRGYTKFTLLPAQLRSRFEALIPDEREEVILSSLNAHVDGNEKRPPATPSPPVVLTSTIPRSTPISAAQAAGWSEHFWPCVYKNTNPYGPHPKILSQSTAIVDADAPRFLALAERAAQACHASNSGPSVGCVVVERRKDGIAEVVSVAGDARYGGVGSANSCAGNVMAHAVMRAMGMVARKRLRVDEDVQGAGEQSAEEQSAYMDLPLNELESKFFALDNIAPRGYLCLNLEIYLTHEPCVMCSMAILHGRFASCVFRRELPLTGALTTSKGKDSNSLGYGLFWHQELNWKFFAWKWLDSDVCGIEDDGSGVHA
ncbi:hypothetical protein P152DRAFT_432629 [Eremomyces bilateralis CBS 781.70]|uniref:CMP/dCMP-type deaminase domain-containing protein n=1 Tax=Eremomyces bilateralis CBS 781.70 TaxID=1392243 RepID=A0A6G1G9H5_9PEZI|nr:uncharacterized protein P152DRAFT_432629 [Eremomyces bilateralis CBS 781.70]KAF1814560.1 hypothetical protein P152DRAFT_432629 [Eremomyces bilateralis CBS 781.70]